jgi:predicted  nucleic acid-binding Zn-ribbon protein
MASWRRRAHEAEARLRTVDERTAQTAAGKPSPEMAALTRENQELKQRLEGAKQRTRQLLDRLRFLRQQHETEVGR